MKKVLVFAAVVGLAGCAAFDTLTSIQVTPQQVVVASAAFDAVEKSAANYLNLPECGPQVSKVCADRDVAETLIPVIRSGRQVREDLQRIAREHPEELGTSGLYASLRSVTTAITSLLGGK